MRNAEKDFQTARTALDLSDGHKWRVCLIAGRYVGLRDGRTAEFAEFLNRTSSQVEHMAKAYRGYRLARPYTKIRKELSPSHFAALFIAWKHIEFHPILCADYLEEAVENRFNSDQLREYIEIDNNLPPKEVNVNRAIENIWALIENIKDHEKHEEAVSLFRVVAELIRTDATEEKEYLTEMNEVASELLGKDDK